MDAFGLRREAAPAVVGSVPLVLFVVIVIVVLGLVGLYVLLTYNRLVTLRLACESSWAQIDAALKLRHDLVPRLVETVRGYASHERAAFDEVTQARSEAVAADPLPAAARGTAEAALGAGLGNLVVLAEAYPDLKASESFTALQGQLVKVEEQLQITRRVYNDTVETYNTKVQVVPAVFVAGAFGFRRRDFFAATVESRTAPSVSLEPGAER